MMFKDIAYNFASELMRSWWTAVFHLMGHTLETYILNNHTTGFSENEPQGTALSLRSVKKIICSNLSIVFNKYLNQDC